MEKGFKAGDRVHVTRLNDEEVDFYATLKEVESINGLFSLSDCSNTKYEEVEVWKIVTKDSCDYYTRENKIELENHYIIEVKKGLYVQNVTSNYFFRFTKYINKAYVYEYKNAALKHAEFVDGHVRNLKRYIEVEQ